MCLSSPSATWMATRTFHPLPKRPSFASVPGSGSGAGSGAGSQRHSHQQHHVQVSSPSTHSRGQPSTASTSPPQIATPTPPAAPAPAASPVSNPSVQQVPFKPATLPPALTETSSLLGSRIDLDRSFNISCAVYTGSILACERFREHIISTWNNSSAVLDHYLIDFGRVQGQITLYKYEDVLCDAEEFSQFDLTLCELIIFLNVDLFNSNPAASSETYPLSGPLSTGIHAGFIRALRERIIHLMCAFSVGQTNKSDPKVIKSSPDSIIFVPQNMYKQDEWTFGWGSNSKR